MRRNSVIRRREGSTEEGNSERGDSADSDFAQERRKGVSHHGAGGVDEVARADRSGGEHSPPRRLRERHADRRRDRSNARLRLLSAARAMADLLRDGVVAGAGRGGREERARQVRSNRAGASPPKRPAAEEAGDGGHRASFFYL